MTDDNQQHEADAIREWTKSVFAQGVQAILDKGVIPFEVVKAKPSWALPKTLVIGQIRDTEHSDSFVWIICGGVPADFVGSAAAATPRDAARHFSLKWQLDATHIADATLAETLIAQAENLYQIAEDDRLWQAQDTG